MTQNIPKEIQLQPDQSQEYLQLIFQQQHTIEQMREQIIALTSEIQSVPQDNVIGWHNDPDWILYEKLKKKKNTKHQTDEIMLKMRTRYGFE